MSYYFHRLLVYVYVCMGREGAGGLVTYTGEFPEEELELFGLLDHAVGSFLALLWVLEGDALLHDRLHVLYYHTPVGLVCHLLRHQHGHTHGVRTQIHTCAHTRTCTCNLN